MELFNNLEHSTFKQLNDTNIRLPIAVAVPSGGQFPCKWLHDCTYNIADKMVNTAQKKNPSKVRRFQVIRKRVILMASDLIQFERQKTEF